MRNLYLVRAMVVKEPGQPTDRAVLEVVLMVAATASVPALFFYDGTLFRFAPR